MKVGVNQVFMVMQIEQRTNQALNGGVTSAGGDAGEGLYFTYLQNAFHLVPCLAAWYLFEYLFRVAYKV